MSGPPAIDTVARVRLLVRDPQAMRKFLAERVGLPVRTASPDRVAFDTEGPVLELQQAGDLPPSRTEIGIQVADLGPVAEALAGRGVELAEGPEEEGWGVYVRFRDPEGNLWSVAHSVHAAPDPPPQPRRIGWVVLTASDVRDLARWYERVLGLPKVWAGARWASFGTRGAQVEMKPGDAGPGRHLPSFLVRDPAEAARALSGRIEVRDGRFADPDGNEWLLEAG